MGYTRPTFEIQGVTFKLKPTSPRNVTELADYIENSTIEDMEEVDEEETIIEATARQYKDILQLIAEPQDGQMTDIDPMDLDINKVDHYLADFMPAGMVT